MDQSHVIVHVQRRFRSEELPQGIFRQADGHPGGVKPISAVIEPLHLFRFEVQRIGRQQDGWIWLPRSLYGAVHLREGSAALSDIVMGAFGLDVLHVGVKLHVAAQFQRAGIGIVFGAIGAQQLVFITHLHVAIGDVAAALLALLVGFELDRCARIRRSDLRRSASGSESQEP